LVFWRILAVVGLLLACGACTPDGGAPPQTASAAASRPGPLPPDIERLVGPLYDSPTLQGLVDEVGQRLVSASGIAGSYRFYVLDQPVANAHAVSTGYVFVTRGLLALIDDDAELAAAVSHELGHVTQRHAAQRERARKGVMEAAVDAALKSGSVTVGR
jgi:predicted Zn-dependent protease